MSLNPKVTVIIPAYNEENVITECLKSLDKQSSRPLEIIVVDDGSTDNTVRIAKNCQLSTVNCQLLHQCHLGPGPARNLGASHAHGDILVFVDADMTFDKNFVKDLIDPIARGKSIGTFSKNEMVKNTNNIWSICWNINRNLPPERMLPANYPNQAPVFRAILKEEFDKVGGFDTTGEYTDDWSLWRKLGVKSTLADGAIYYHSNPSTLAEVWRQARWIGKNEFITSSLLRKIRSLVLYSLPVSLIIGLTKSVINLNGLFLVFKIWYDFAVWVSTAKSFFGERKAK